MSEDLHPQASTQPGDAVTILTCRGEHHASKRFVRSGDQWQKYDFELGSKFGARRYEVGNLDELAQVIEVMRQTDNAILVRGELTPEAMEAIKRDPTFAISRRKNDADGTTPAPLVEVPRRWCMCDIDNHPLPPDADLLRSPEEVVDAAIRALLPPPFHDADCYFQFSNSCGFVPDILKVHLWFWLMIPVGNPELRAIFQRTASQVDRAPFNAVQPHFVCDPVVVGGIDPLRNRTGWRRGTTKMVDVKALLARADNAQRSETIFAVPPLAGDKVADALARLGDGDGRDGFHAPLRAATMQYAIRCNLGDARDDQAMIAKVRDCISAAPQRSDRQNVMKYLELSYLEQLITGAFKLLSTSAGRQATGTDGSFGVPGFRNDLSGLWYTDPVKPAASPERIADPFELVGACEDGSGTGWGVVLKWKDAAERQHLSIISRSALHGQPGHIAGTLDEQGLRCNPAHVAKLRKFLAEAHLPRRLKAVERAGWQGATYVMADGTIFGCDDVILRPEVTTTGLAFAQAGTLSEWKTNVAQYAASNCILAFFVCAALAAPLLDIIDEPSGGFHLHGQSQSGKTTAMLVGSSVVGKGARGGAVRQWRTTSNGLEGVAAQSSDNVLCLDEISQSDGRDAGDTIYMLANEQGKQRASQTGAAKQIRTWRIIFLSTGETTLAQKMAESGKRALTGMEVRLVNLTADAGAGMGVFEDLHGFADPGAFADYLREVSAKYYGVAGRAMLKQLAEDRRANEEDLKRLIRQYRDIYLAKYLPAGADGQVRSVVGRFGVVAAAGEIGQAFGVLPWKEDEADTLISRCLLAWLAERGTVGAGEDQIALRQIRAFLELHGNSRFTSMRVYRARVGEEPIQEADGGATINRCGWRRFDTDKRRWDYLILPETWKTELCKGIDSTRTAKALLKGGWLAPGDGRHLTRHETIPEIGRVRVYVVLGSILEGWEGD